MYLIRNRKTKKYVYGTDYRYSPPHQRTSKSAAHVYEYLYQAILEFKTRKCGKDYEIASVNIEYLDTVARYEDIMDSTFVNGVNVAEGFAIGIRNGRSAVIEATKSIAQNAIDAERKVLKIYSPSKKWIEAVVGKEDAYNH